MKWIGLTGGIGVGKSSVCKILAKNSFEVVEADKIIHHELDKKGVISQIKEYFGPWVLLGDKIDKKKLAKLVFCDKTKLLKLESILHPLVHKTVSNLKENLKTKGKMQAFYEIPLLFEKNLQNEFDVILTVASNSNLVNDRLLKKGLSKKEINQRIKFQMPQAEKISKSTFVIWNNTSLEDLEKSCNQVLNKIINQ